MFREQRRLNRHALPRLLESLPDSLSRTRADDCVSYSVRATHVRSPVYHCIRLNSLAIHHYSPSFIPGLARPRLKWAAVSQCYFSCDFGRPFVERFALYAIGPLSVCL